MYQRTLSAQLTNRPRAAVHWLDGVIHTHAYGAPTGGGYWVSRCGIRGHFTPILHRRSKGPWCQRCKAMAPRTEQKGYMPMQLDERRR